MFFIIYNKESTRIVCITLSEGYLKADFYVQMILNNRGQGS
jgi:hypothetical protein